LVEVRHHEVGWLFQDPEALGSADEMALSRLPAYHGRVDHSNEGHFDEMVERGHTIKLLRRMKKQY
jgi:hypothetical protein